nr:MAG TPA: hypothetical protein [Caudoviricetes sp.]
MTRASFLIFLLKNQCVMIEFMKYCCVIWNGSKPQT